MKHFKIDFKSFDVYSYENIRQGIKKYSNWPTIPQIYVNKEFIGGSDILKEMFEKKELEKLGYDTYMVFVNTNLEATLKRNDARERTVPVNVVKDRWKTVQDNLAKFKAVFKGNLQVVDNSDHLEPEEAQKKFNMLAQKGIDKFLKKPIKNKIAKDWIKKQKILTKQGIK